MSRNPIITFGRAATATAMNAKCGRMKLAEKLDLATAALRLKPSDERVLDAVVSFLDTVDEHPEAAATSLQDFLGSWLNEVSPRDAQEIATPLHDWQKRADLR